MDSCNTVKIKTEKVAGNDFGYIVINESDYDPDQHDLFVENEATDGGEAEESAGGEEGAEAKAPSKDKLVAEAAKLKIAAPSVLARWSSARLAEAVAEATKA
jgi:hypothetical protein